MGSIPAAWSNWGSIVERTLGSNPSRAGFIPPNMAAAAAALLDDTLGCDAVLSDGPTDDLLGVDLPSLPSLEDTLALEGGLGDGPSLCLGDGAGFFSLELGECLPLLKASMPGIAG